MSRCSCCDIPLKWREFKMKQDDGSEESLCSTCLSYVYSPNQCYTKTYQFEDICDEFYVAERYEE